MKPPRVACLQVALVGALALLLHEEAASACQRNTDGSPVITTQWITDPLDLPRNCWAFNGDTTPCAENIGDSNVLMWIGGIALGPGDETFHTDWLGNESIRRSLFTHGLNWANGGPDNDPYWAIVPSGSIGWFLGGYTSPADATHLEILSVEKDCFLPDGITYLGVNTSREFILKAQANCNDDNVDHGWWDCSYRHTAVPGGPGVTGWRNAAMMLSSIAFPGWGFGEYVSIEQSGDPNQPSYLVAHDESCDWHTVMATGTAIGMVGGIEPAQFAGPGPQQLAATCETCEPGGGDPTGRPPPPIKMPPPTQALFGNYEDVRGYSLNQIGIGGTIWLAKASDAFCYLTGLQGKLTNDWDGASIVQTDVAGTLYWRLAVHPSPDGSVGASANCYLYDQRAFFKPPSGPPPGPIDWNPVFN